MRVHQREGSVVADRADIAEMIGEPLQFRHQRAQTDRARGGASKPSAASTARAKAMRIGDGAVAGDARRRAAPLRERRAAHQRVDALVDIAEPLFQPHHGFAVGGEAEMAGLDDAGMNRSDRNLMQALAFDRQERISGCSAGAGAAAPSGCARPAAVIEPGPRVGRADRLPVRTGSRMARSKPDRRRMQRADRRKIAVAASKADNRDIAALVVDQRHVHGRRRAGIAPQAEQRRASCGQCACDWRQPSAVTTTRGQGRCASTGVPCGMMS